MRSFHLSIFSVNLNIILFHALVKVCGAVHILSIGDKWSEYNIHLKTIDKSNHKTMFIKRINLLTHFINYTAGR